MATDWIGPAIVLVVATVWIVGKVHKHRAPDDVARLKQAYANGEIDTDEFERRLAFMLDDRNAAIREAAETVNGIGPETSRAIAEEFEDLDAVRTADVDRLTEVPGVGDQYAAALAERLSE